MSDLQILYIAFRRAFSVFMIFVMIGAVVLLIGLVMMFWNHHQACQADQRDHTNFVCCDSSC